MKILILIVFCSLTLLIPHGNVSACSYAFPPGDPPKLTGVIINYPGGTFGNVDTDKYFSITYKEGVATCDGDRVFVNKMFTYVALPILSLLLIILAIYTLRKFNLTNKK